MMHGGHPIFGAGGVILIATICMVIAFVLGIIALWTAAWCMIFRRAGYPWAVGLLVLVPIAGAVLVLVLAFSKWPIEREIEELRTFARHYMPAPSAPAPYAPQAPQAPSAACPPSGQATAP